MYRGAGFLTWALISGLALYLSSRGSETAQDRIPLYVALIVGNLVTMQLAVQHSRFNMPLRRVAHGLQALCALTFAWMWLMPATSGWK